MKSGVYNRFVSWVGGVPDEPAYGPGLDDDILVAVTLDWPEEVCDQYFENLNT